MKYPEDFINKIICGDCLEVMKIMPDNCIDTIITDPPYGLEFMGKKWDKLSRNLMDPNSKKDIERKEKYGRNYAGRRSNLPDLSKLNKYGYDIQKWHYDWAIEALRVAKPGSSLLCFGGTRTYHRLACAIEDAGWILKDCIMWIYGSGFPKATDISKQIDKRAGKKRNVVGRYELPDVADGIRKKGWENKSKSDKSIFGVSGQVDITAPATPEATLWNGWKSHGLKPAYEPILVAMKPNEGNYANNALKWGVAGLNMDGGRIELNGEQKIKATNITGFGNNNYKLGTGRRYTNQGRFPANVILDEESARLLDKQSGVSKSAGGENNEKYKDTAIWGNAESMYKHFGDMGGASRFFYCAKASKAERNRGCEGLEGKRSGSMVGCVDDGNFLTGSGNPRKGVNKNNHPTVKPLELMKYLCTLTKTPTGGIVLDPFCGSGTTLMACKETGRKYIGIEIDKEYVEIAQRRLRAIEAVLF